MNWALLVSSAFAVGSFGNLLRTVVEYRKQRRLFEELSKRPTNPGVGLPLPPSSKLKIVLSPLLKKTAERALKGREKRIARPPGQRSLAVLAFVFPRRVVDRVFAQTIADAREEHTQALLHGELGKARWIAIRLLLELGLALLWMVPDRLVKMVKSALG